MADNREVENDEPAQEQQYQPTLELRKQLEHGPKYVQLQREARTYAMALSVNVIQEPDADDVMRIPPAIPGPDSDGAMQGAVGEEVRQESGGTYDTLGPDNNREFESDCIYVQRTLGHGGFGIVYRAELRRGEQTDRLCLKMGLHKRKYKSEDERVRGQQEVNKSILREARHYNNLPNNPYIVSMQFCCTSRDYNEVFLALDYCQGITLSYLANRYRDKNLSTKLLHKIMLESTLAVQHCISHGIVHCDIKPSNIIFAGMDRPLKLIDFGCAVNLGEGIDPRRDIAGTWEYMAPEILLHGLRSLDNKSDVYSLGALLFKVVTRRTPWFHNEEIRIVLGDRERRAEVKDIIAKELCKSSEEPNEELKQTALQSILTDGNSLHLSRIPEQCNLVCRMLSFHHSDRPSCEEILEDMTTMRKKKVKPVAPDGSSETDESHIPATVFSFNTTTSKGAQATTSTVSVEYMDIPSGDLLSGREYNSSFYGPSSKESLINEELRVDYAGAMADEVDEQHVELRRLQKELRAVTERALQKEQELRAAKERLLQQQQELRAVTERVLQQEQAGKITLDTSKVVMSQWCYSVSETPAGRLLVGRTRGFDICNRDGSIARSVTVSTGYIICIQYYNELVYTLCAEPGLGSKRYVIVFDSNTYSEVRRWSVPDYECISNIAVMYDKVYVSDPDSEQLCVYSLAGDHITNIEHSTFSIPDYLAISSPDSIIIGDYGANKVHKLNSRDDMVTWTCTAVDGPRGVCCDTNGDVWVWSHSTKSIFLLSSQTGEIISEIKHDVFTDMDGAYKIISGMCITREDRVLWAAATLAGLLQFPTK